MLPQFIKPWVEPSPVSLCTVSGCFLSRLKYRVYVVCPQPSIKVQTLVCKMEDKGLFLQTKPRAVWSFYIVLGGNDKIKEGWGGFGNLWAFKPVCLISCYLFISLISPSPVSPFYLSFFHFHFGQCRRNRVTMEVAILAVHSARICVTLLNMIIRQVRVSSFITI